MSLFKKLQAIIIQNIKQNSKIMIGGTALGIIGWIILRKYIDKLYRKINNYPPGLIGLPVFGCLFKNLDNKFCKHLSDNYGGVVMLQMGFRYVTYINDCNLTKKAFKKMEFCGREPLLFATQTLAVLNGQEYIKRRQIFLRSFISMINSDYVTDIGSEILQMYLFTEFDKSAAIKKPILITSHIHYTCKYMSMYIHILCIYWIKFIGQFM